MLWSLIKMAIEKLLRKREHYKLVYLEELIWKRITEYSQAPHSHPLSGALMWMLHTENLMKTAAWTICYQKMQFPQAEGEFALHQTASVWPKFILATKQRGEGRILLVSSKHPSPIFFEWNIFIFLLLIEIQEHFVFKYNV